MDQDITSAESTNAEPQESDSSESVTSPRYRRQSPSVKKGAPSFAKLAKKTDDNPKPKPNESNVEQTKSPSPSPKKKVITIGNKYKLGEPLGQGAFSIVSRGLNVETGNFVAIKRIKRDKLAEEPLLAEIELLKSFNHENIVRYIDVVITESHINLILEYIESGSLAQVVEKFGVFPESLVAMYIEQVLQGLTYLHEHGVAHRDIKGPNLLITKDGNVKLADFGIASTCNYEDKNSSFSATVIEGSPFWMAPEVISQSNVSTSCDIWSLGCTIIELLTGYPPYFDNSGITALYRMAQDPHPPLPDDISPDLKDFLLSCFQKDPTKRPTAKDLLKHMWITKMGKGEKRKSWRDTLRKVQQYNTKKKRATLQGLSLANIDWSQLKESPATPLQESYSDSDISPASNSLNDLSLVSSPPGVTDQQSNPLGIGHTSSVSLTSSNSSNSSGQQYDFLSKTNSSKSNSFPASSTHKDIQFIAVITGTETKKNFLFSYTVYKVKVCVTFPKELARCWIVLRSFSDFQALDSKVRQLILEKNPSEFNSLPELPKMKWFGTTEPQYVNFIVVTLKTYMSRMHQVPIPAVQKLLFGFFSPDQPLSQSENTNSK